MSRLCTVIVLALLALLALSGAAQASGCRNADVDPTVAPAAARAATVCLINVERRAHGARRLRANRLLAVAASRHSGDMVRRHYFSHVSRGGSTAGSRIKTTGYLAHAASWAIGENLAWGTLSAATPRQIVKRWMASPGHRRNMLDRRFTQVGIGVAIGAPTGARRAATYSAEFGRRD